MSEGRIPKPQLRDLHITKAGKSLGIGVVVAVGCGITYKLCISNPHNRKVEEFYKTYDPMKSLKIMNDAGLMESTSK
ncbi:Cytochrome c oxidase subunit 6C [Habropoda laboriosa]|uniref:Cytochrome c oxidase subunit 6C n=1 Tax=Habropoda laboriosa TaxID=597456 RepID=A0A0L7QV32_9HYME|nr:PREDICTED: cytochrome c oxidase subunit 6C-1-like [Habropoda laboriosa]KOC62414.1 Cytochrome c oxidase subunit 6C [Habropoda laboriosa]